MSMPANFVTIHPYFRAHPGKLEEIKSTFSDFCQKTASEKGNLFYDFTVGGQIIFCREGYAGAEALLAHLENVNVLLIQMLKIADLVRLEVHGPAAELEKLRKPMAELKPEWFVKAELQELQTQ